jgi:hypothetical protein
MVGIEDESANPLPKSAVDMDAAWDACDPVLVQAPDFIEKGQLSDIVHPKPHLNPEP